MLNELILELKQKNVHLYLQDGKLRCRGLPSVLSPNLKTALQEHKTELTEYLIKAQQNNGLFASIGKASRHDPLLLSSAQYRLWVLAQLDSSNVAYNIPAALRLTGNLDIEVCAIIARATGSSSVF